MIKYGLTAANVSYKLSSSKMDLKLNIQMLNKEMVKKENSSKIKAKDKRISTSLVMA